MTSDELRDQLGALGVSCRVQRGEVVVEECRFCGNPKWNLELNPQRGLYHCWACNSGGRLDTLLQEWLNDPGLYILVAPRDSGATAQPTAPTEFASIPAYQSPIAARYLTNRGIDMDTAKHYGLVICNEDNHRLAHRLVIPIHDFWTGAVVGHLGRMYYSAPRQSPKYLSTLTTRQIVTGYRVRAKNSPCVLVEGFFDGIAIHSAGFDVAVLSGTHAPWVTGFGARITATTPILIVLDGSAEREAQRLAWVLRQVHPALVHVQVLPDGRDPADFKPEVLRLLLSGPLSSLQLTTNNTRTE